MKCFTNNSLLSRDKTISSLLELIGYVLSFRICFRKTVNFDFDEKLVQSNVQIKDFFSLHIAVGQVLSISEYDLENRNW